MYVNAYVIAVPEDRKDDYAHIARVYTEVARDFGAIEVFENWEREVPDGELTDFRRAVNAVPGERVVLSWTIWPDRETGRAAHKGMYDDPRMLALGPMPFDSKRMILGGFEPLTHFRSA